LLINPHTSFFFRSELQMTSDEGLNSYGAATWGQFFIYQGFNDRAGWMHTSSGVDVVDEFLETVSEKNGRLVYNYGSEERPVAVSTVQVPYRAATARWRAEASRSTAPTTARSSGSKTASGSPFSMMHRPVEALSQSFLRTKAKTSLLHEGDGAEGELVQQHRSSPMPRAISPISTRSSSRGGTTVSTTPSPWTAAIRRRTGTASTR
jgi:acyl-homoserine lactone acylase PvdQ